MLGGAPAVDAAYRDLILVNETRTELKGSIAAWIGLTAGAGFLAYEFSGRAAPLGFAIWLGLMGLLSFAWLAAWISFIRKPPTDEAILRRWIPGAKAGMTLCNLATAFGVWVFLPVAGPELRALLLVLYAWFLIIQFAAATEATQVLTGAVVLVLGSLTVWLLVAQPPYFLPLSLFFPLFGATLIAIRRFVRQAVVAARLAQAEADEARERLAKAMVELERERDARTQFIRAASHDLQQPLQAASLFLDRVQPAPADGGQATALGGLRRALTAARTLVGAMLDHLKLDAGVVTADFQTIAAAEVFDRVLLTQAPAAAVAGIRIRIAGQRIMLRADPLLLARAIENLMANAIRHSGGQRILLGVRAQGDRTLVWVLDDGAGLALGDEARIFQPFQQGAKVGAAGGFGLGLAATRNLAALMDGDCGLASGLVRGAAFWIALPAPTEDASTRCAA